MRLAIAGAGAVVETFHLPATRLCPEIRVVALADKNLERARKVAARFGVPDVVGDYRDLRDGVDAALIALPNALHAPAALELLGRRIPVLVEKPMALGVAEAERMIHAARMADTVLAAALVGRHAAGAQYIRRTLSEERLGALKTVDLEYGIAFAWRSASSFLFRKEQAGGGVLIDLGTHMLDLAAWMIGRPTLLDYHDDAMGGVEGECTVHLSFAGPSGAVDGRVSLSRLRTLTNVMHISGERGTIDWDIATDTVSVDIGGQRSAAEVPRRSLLEMFAAQLRAFTGAVLGADDSAVGGESALAVIELIESCYRSRRDLEHAWTKPVLSI